MKTLAFCFLIYDIINHEELWYEFFKNIDMNKYNIYIHYKNNKPLKYFEKYKLNNCFPTKYCHVSIVHAHNLLFKKAVEDNCYKIISLSQACVPVKSFDHIYDFLTKDNLCHFNIMPRQVGCFPRCNKLLNYYDKDSIQKSSNWFILNHNIAKDLTDVSYDKINSEYNDIYAPEEHYYITTIFYKNLQEEIVTTPNSSNNATTFTNWHNMRYKYKDHRGLKNYSNISKEELEYLVSSYCLFGRKFKPECIVTPDNKPLKDILITYII